MSNSQNCTCQQSSVNCRDQCVRMKGSTQNLCCRTACTPSGYAGSRGPQQGRFSNNSKFTQLSQKHSQTQNTHPYDLTLWITRTLLHPWTWFTSSCSNTIPQDCAAESVFNNSMAIHVQTYKHTYRLREGLPLTRVLTAYERVLTVDKVTSSRAHKGLGQVDMLRNGMGWQLLEHQLVHSQPQNGMCGRLQAAASFASEVCNEEVQASLPAYDVGD